MLKQLPFAGCIEFRACAEGARSERERLPNPHHVGHPETESGLVLKQLFDPFVEFRACAEGVRSERERLPPTT